MDFNVFKKRAAETANILADKSAALAKMAADKTKLAAKIAKLKTEIAAERDNLRRAYTELGKTCYEKFKDSPDDAMAQTIMEITTAIEHIDALNKDVEDLKTEDAMGEADIDVEIIVEEETAEPEPEDAPEPPEAPESSEEPEVKE